MPASCISRMAAAAISGVCSAGLAITELPATSAAAIWPVKIASGKFHGLMQTNTPRPRWCSSLVSPVGPGMRSGASGARACARVVAAEVDRLAHLRQRIVERLAAFRLQQRDQRVAVLLVEIGGALERGGASATGVHPCRKAVAPPHRGMRARVASARADQRHRSAKRLRASLRACRRPAARRRFGVARTPPAAPQGSRDRRTPRPPSSSAPAHTDRAAAECADAARGLRPRSMPAAASGSSRPAPTDRPRPTRTTSSRRSPAAAAPDRRAGRDARRPAHRRGRRRPVLRDQRLVERLAHAVQALEFVAFDAARLLDHARDGQRIVRGELRIELRPRGEQLASRRPCRRDRSSPCG